MGRMGVSGAAGIRGTPPWEKSEVVPIEYFTHPIVSVSPRDLLLLQMLGTKVGDVTLEVGTGSGTSILRLSRVVREAHGVDVAEGALARLRAIVAASSIQNVQLWSQDFCAPDVPSRFEAFYDVVLSCDTLEHVAAPDAFLMNCYRALKPGGQLFLTFPNEHPGRAHGITFFERRSELLDLLVRAGFDAARVRIETIDMSLWSRIVFTAAWRVPNHVMKRAFSVLGLMQPAHRPQTFDETDFFSTADKWERWAPVINAYCWAVMRFMCLSKRVYEPHSAPEVLWDTTVLIRGTR